MPIILSAALLLQGAVCHAAQDVTPTDTVSLLPCGIPGLPEDYALPAGEMKEKHNMQEHDVIEAIGTLKPGLDYREGEVFTLADSEEQALAYAEAFNGRLLLFSDGVATIELPEDLTVLQAVSASSDPACMVLPAVDPVYCIRLDPGEMNGEFSDEENSVDNVTENASDPVNPGIPDSMTDTMDPSGSSNSGSLHYQDYVSKGLVDDPFLLHPEEQCNHNGKQYQWQHDLMHSWEAWTYGFGSGNVKVGIIDTGVLKEHEDFAGTRITQYDYCSRDERNDNYVSAAHGTHVAGIICAVPDNGAYR